MKSFLSFKQKRIHDKYKILVKTGAIIDASNIDAPLNPL
jgi:hypothetical protein